MSRNSGKMHLNENPATMHELSDSTDLMADDEALSERAHADGYLWLRNVLPQADVHITAADLAKVMARAGWIERDKPLAIAAANLGKRCVEPQPDFMDVFYAQLALKSVHALKAHPVLQEVFDQLFSEPALCVPQSVMRLAFPAMQAYATPAHQDYVHFEGSTKNWAVWIPFTPIKPQTGGLAIAAGSHLHGPYDICPSLGAGQMTIDTDLTRLDWRWSPMQPGDVLIHNCLTVHRGLANEANSMRVSMDARYQPVSAPIGEKYLGMSHQMRDWDDLYAGWTGDELKYYWRHLDLDIVPFTYKWYDRRNEAAIKMGEAGDAEATVALENIVLKHRSMQMRARAEHALATLRAS